MLDCLDLRAVARGGARERLIEIGAHRLGPPETRVQAQLAAIDDHARLRALAARLFDASTWDELLASA
jgi:hypothetical protein